MPKIGMAGEIDLRAGVGLELIDTIGSYDIDMRIVLHVALSMSHSMKGRFGLLFYHCKF